MITLCKNVGILWRLDDEFRHTPHHLVEFVGDIFSASRSKGSHSSPSQQIQESVTAARCRAPPIRHWQDDIKNGVGCGRSRVFRDLEAFPRMGTPPSGVAAGNAKKGKFRRVKMNSKLLGRSVGRLGAIGYWRILHGLSSFVYM